LDFTASIDGSAPYELSLPTENLSDKPLETYEEAHGVFSVRGHDIQRAPEKSITDIQAGRTRYRAPLTINISPLSDSNL
jgi:hypothetical protein